MEGHVDMNCLVYMGTIFSTRAESVIHGGLMCYTPLGGLVSSVCCHMLQDGEIKGMPVDRCRGYDLHFDMGRVGTTVTHSSKVAPQRKRFLGSSSTRISSFTAF